MTDFNDQLGTPGRRGSFKLPRLRIDQESFGRFAEWIARYMGSAAFLILMTLFIGFWISWNNLMPEAIQFDSPPFILLNLMLSIEAAYSAPLVLLAQNRQEARDRMSLEEDRRVAGQSRADMDFLAREIASLRNNVGELATRDFVRSEIRDQLRDLLADLETMKDTSDNKDPRDNS